MIPAARRIAICCHDFNRGGTERVALTLAAHWAAMGREVAFIVGTQTGGLEHAVPPGVTVIECAPVVPRSPLSRLKLRRAMVAPLCAFAPDVVFLTGNFHFVLAPVLKRALPAVPVVAKVSNPLLSGAPGWASGLVRVGLRRVVRGIDHLVYMAPELAAEGQRLLPARAATVIAEPTLPAGFVPPVRGAAEAEPLVLAIGRMEPQKDMALALRAFARLRARRPARLAILGDGPERAKLQRLARRLGIADAVEMPGFVDPAPWLARASALLLASRYEGYPAVVIEALAADVPVVATPCTVALGSLLGDGLGLVVPGEAEALAAGLSEILDWPFGSGGVRPGAVARHDAARSAGEYLACFDAAVIAGALGE